MTTKYCRLFSPNSFTQWKIKAGISPFPKKSNIYIYINFGHFLILGYLTNILRSSHTVVLVGCSRVAASIQNPSWIPANRGSNALLATPDSHAGTQRLLVPTWPFPCTCFTSDLEDILVHPAVTINMLLLPEPVQAPASQCLLKLQSTSLTASHSFPVALVVFRFLCRLYSYLPRSLKLLPCLSCQP